MSQHVVQIFTANFKTLGYIVIYVVTTYVKVKKKNSVEGFTILMNRTDKSVNVWRLYNVL